jgi:hypothetical protein
MTADTLFTLFTITFVGLAMFGIGNLYGFAKGFKEAKNDD